MARPRVSIGLPVRDGERYVGSAIESVRAQTHEDWELVIVDNASTDRTGAICQDLAADDPRIRYVRNDRDLGAARNFNRAFALSRGEHFQWLAHDDGLMPDFLARCVAALDSDPSAVLAFTDVTIIDETGAVVDDCVLRLPFDAEEPHRRFRSVLLDWHNSYHVFGLMRAAALRGSALIRPYAHGDTILLAELSLRGRFVQLPGGSFVSRRHAAQSNRTYVDESVPRNVNLHTYSAWYDAEAADRLRFPYWRVIAEYARSIEGTDVDLRNRAHCVAALAHLAIRYRSGLLLDVHRALRRTGPSPVERAAIDEPAAGRVAG